MIEGGLLLLDKPSGLTSHGALQRVRRVLGTRRIGHTGTLDPFASGLLLALVGPFTRLADLYHVWSKSYEAEMELGQETDTHDLTGDSTSQSSAWRSLTPEHVDQALRHFTGEYLQRPPRFSARRVGGKRSHAEARKGRSLALEPRSVVVYEAAVTSVDLPRVSFSVRVSTGTYVRALARDVGRKLGCGAHLTALRRTRIGPFTVEDAVEPACVGVGCSAWLRKASMVPWLRQREVSPTERGFVQNGRSIPGDNLVPPTVALSREVAPSGKTEEHPVALTDQGELIAIATEADGWLHPKKVLVG